MKGSTRDIQAALRREVISDGSNRYGVVIGTEEYSDERLNLHCARADWERINE